MHLYLTAKLGGGGGHAQPATIHVIPITISHQGGGRFEQI